MAASAPALAAQRGRHARDRRGSVRPWTSHRVAGRCRRATEEYRRGFRFVWPSTRARTAPSPACRKRPFATGGSANAPWPGSRPRGRNGGRTFALSKAQVRLAQAAMAHRDTSVSALCRELGILTAPRAGRPGTAPVFAAGLAEVPVTA